MILKGRSFGPIPRVVAQNDLAHFDEFFAGFPESPFWDFWCGHGAGLLPCLCSGWLDRFEDSVGSGCGWGGGKRVVGCDDLGIEIFASEVDGGATEGDGGKGFGVLLLHAGEREGGGFGDRGLEHCVAGTTEGTGAALALVALIGVMDGEDGAGKSALDNLAAGDELSHVLCGVFVTTNQVAGEGVDDEEGGERGVVLEVGDQEVGGGGVAEV